MGLRKWKEIKMKFRKKPVVIDAFHWVGLIPDPAEPEWFREKVNDGEVLMEIIWDDDEGCLRDVKLEITTLEGVMNASVGDWIIQGVNGEIYPCKPDIFEKTYEKVEEQ